MQNLNNFLVKSCVEDYTNSDSLYSAKNVVVENGRYMVNKLYYEHIERELIDYNSNNLEVYNNYAEKSEGAKIYPASKKIYENGKKRKISDTVKKLSGQIIEGGKTYPNFDDYGNR